MNKQSLDGGSFRGNIDLSKYEEFVIKSFRDIREVKGIGSHETVIGIPLIGDSLNNIGILHGDLLVVKLTQHYGAETNLGVWETPNGRTAKFAYENFDTIVLHNKAEWSQTWATKEVKLIGVVVRVERDLEVLR